MMSLGRDREVEALWSAEDMIELLASFPDRWSVYQRHECRGIGHQKRVKQG